MKPSKFTALAIAIVTGLALAHTAAAGGRSDLVLAALQAGKAQHVPNEILVQFRATASAADRSAIVHGLGASRLQTLRGGKASLELLRLPPGVAMASGTVAGAPPRVGGTDHGPAGTDPVPRTLRRRWCR